MRQAVRIRILTYIPEGAGGELTGRGREGAWAWG